MQLFRQINSRFLGKLAGKVNFTDFIYKLMRSNGTWWILLVIMFLLDWYVFQAVRAVSAQASDRTRMFIFGGYWLLSVAALLAVLLFPYITVLQTSKIFRNYVFAILAGLFFSKVIAGSFFLFDDVRRLVVFAMGKIFPSSGANFMSTEGTISRSVFISWLGLVFGGGLFGTLLFGFRNKYNYQVRRIKLNYPNLPTAFKGLKAVQISDVHSGSFQNKAAVNKGIEMILQEKPDLIFFTGDLVNDRHEEMLEYIDVFSQLKAPMGVYSTLGNHDYGDYVQWPSKEVKMANLEKLKGIHAQMGWRLLMNEHVVLERGQEKIAVIGIENWSAKGRFPKYGKMADAYAGTQEIPFKILLSHDPSHWEAEVIPQYSDVDLMLAGHTHGMQFGLENPYIKWSPVKWVYKQWAGLYSSGKQHLYVNRGFGFIGYPGRVGILPEITVLEFA